MGGVLGAEVGVRSSPPPGAGSGHLPEEIQRGRSYRHRSPNPMTEEVRWRERDLEEVLLDGFFLEKKGKENREEGQK